MVHPACRQGRHTVAMAQRVTWTVMETIRWTTEYLRSRGIEKPRLDAELLLAHALNLERIDLYLQHDRPLSQSELTRFKTLVKLRAARKSVAHIIGYREFWKTRFLTPEPVFVPRPETELIVEAVLERTETDAAFDLLDLCTGTGNIPISVLLERPFARASAVDILPQAVDAALANAKIAKVQDRLDVTCQDAAEFLCSTKRRFHFVTCNPPYVPTSQWEKLLPEVKDHESRCAVDGGADGLSFIRTVLPLIPRVLLPNGSLFLEYSGAEQTGAIVQLMNEVGFRDVVVRRDLAGIERVVCSHRPADPS